MHDVFPSKLSLYLNLRSIIVGYK